MNTIVIHVKLFYIFVAKQHKFALCFCPYFPTFYVHIYYFIELQLCFKNDNLYLLHKNGVFHLYKLFFCLL